MGIRLFAAHIPNTIIFLSTESYQFFDLAVSLVIAATILNSTGSD